MTRNACHHSLALARAHCRALPFLSRKDLARSRALTRWCLLERSVERPKLGCAARKGPQFGFVVDRHPSDTGDLVRPWLVWFVFIGTASPSRAPP